MCVSVIQQRENAGQAWESLRHGRQIRGELRRDYLGGREALGQAYLLVHNGCAEGLRTQTVCAILETSSGLYWNLLPGAYECVRVRTRSPQLAGRLKTGKRAKKEAGEAGAPQRSTDESAD